MIILENDITVISEAVDKLNRLKKITTITNPEYVARQKLNLATFVPDKLNYWIEPADNTLKLPMGVLRDVIALFPDEEYKDLRFESQSLLACNFIGKLGPEQEQAVATLLDNKTGILEAPTGSGKTVCAIALICARKQPTLILVNTIELLRQFYDRLLAFTDLHKNQVGVIGAGKKIIRPITIGTFQSLNKMSSIEFEELNGVFGQVVPDEVHITGARTFYHVMSQMKAKYKIGLSATPDRPDSLMPVVYFGTGPIIHTITAKSLEHKRAKVTYRKINTDYNFELMFTTDYGEMINDLSENIARNELIAATMKDVHGKSLILCQRISQVEALHNLLPNSFMMHSKQPAKERKKIFAEWKDAHGDVQMVSTYGLFSTGIDDPEIKTVAFGAPTRSKIRVVQSVGRARRKMGDITADILDFVDYKVDILRWQGTQRERIVNKEIRNG